MPPHEALRIAFSKGLDLVEIAPKSKPPVCKIVEYGKYNYERQKKDKLTKKNQVVILVKEIRFNANTDTHDIDFKTKHIRQFLKDGNKVKASVIYKGRMITHPEIGQKLMEEILDKVKDVAKIEAPPKMEGKMLIVYLMPDKAKIAALEKAGNQEPKKQEPEQKENIN
jgi:translation initiation factor IF-3